MLRAALAAVATAALVIPAAEASASAAAIPWLSATCGGLVALQHDASRARSTTTSAPARQVAVDAKADVAVLGRAASTAPTVRGGAALAGALVAVVGEARVALEQQRLALERRTTPKAVAAYAVSVSSISRALGATFRRLLVRYGSTELDGAVDQVPACRVVHG